MANSSVIVEENRKPSGQVANCICVPRDINHPILDRFNNNKFNVLFTHTLLKTVFLGYKSLHYRFPSILLALFTPALNGVSGVKMTSVKRPKIHDFSPGSGRYFLALIFETIHLLRHQRKGSGGEVKMLI